MKSLPDWKQFSTDLNTNLLASPMLNDAPSIQLHLRQRVLSLCCTALKHSVMHSAELQARSNDLRSVNFIRMWDATYSDLLVPHSSKQSCKKKGKNGISNGLSSSRVLRFSPQRAQHGQNQNPVLPSTHAGNQANPPELPNRKQPVTLTRSPGLS